MVGLGVAVVLRAIVSGRSGAVSMPAGTVFALVVAALALGGGWRPGRPRLVSMVVGAVAGAVLVVVPVAVQGSRVAGSGGSAAHMALWTVVVSAVALSEEMFLRGALWVAVEREVGALAAVVTTTVVFAVMHVPLYGWRAVPLDLGVGLALAALRVWSGGVAAPGVAHVVADLAGGWL